MFILNITLNLTFILNITFKLMFKINISYKKSEFTTQKSRGMPHFHGPGGGGYRDTTHIVPHARHRARATSATDSGPTSKLTFKMNLKRNLRFVLNLSWGSF